MDNIKKESAKRVITKGLDSKKNGWLLEMFKDKSGVKTEVYLTVTSPSAFKGFHLHKIRSTRIICLKGKVRVYTYTNDNNAWIKKEFILDGDNPERIIIPKNVAIGLENIGEGEAWLVNYPDPPYDPNLHDEQIEYTKAELENGIVK